MRDTKVNMMSVAKLHKRLDDAVFAVPRLQREFVWNGRKAAALLDSIYRGMPIGTILVWNTGRSSQHLLRKVLHILPPYSDVNDEIWFLIDGQQRLSVLYQAVKGEARENSDGREVDFSRLVFSVLNDADDNGDTLFHYRKPIEGQYIPIKDILSPRWRYKLRKLPQYKMYRIEGCRERVLKYDVPVQFVASGDIEEIRELFIRINSLGTPIASADRAFARASEFDIRSSAHEIREALPRDFHDLPYETILQTFALVAGRAFRDVGERAYAAAIRHWERLIAHDKSQMRSFHRLWRRVKTAILKSVDYLRQNFCVWGQAFLPSDNMIATLSVFFFENAQVVGRQKQEIRKWFWATGVGQRYSGRGYRENILKDAEFFRRLAAGRGRFVLNERIDPAEVKRAEYNRRTSVANAFYCLLLCHAPRYVISGDTVPPAEYATYANRKHRHHIFPQALLNANRFNHRQYNTICNICLIVAEENHEFGARRPDSYFAPYCKRRHFRAAMKSHLIPCRPDSAIWVRGVRRAYPLFVKQRQEIICRAFEEAAGMRLFRRE